MADSEKGILNPDWDEYSRARLLSRNRLLYEHHRLSIKLFVDYFKDVDISSRVLDIGCGDGFFMEILRDLGFEYLEGIDPSEVALSRARKKGLQVRQDDIYALAREEGEQYDAIILMDVIEHLNDPFLAIQIIHHLLVQGGRFYLSTLVCDSLAKRFQRLLLRQSRLAQSRVWDETHVWAPTKREVVELLQRNSFRIEFARRISNRLPYGERISSSLQRFSQQFAWGGLFGDLLCVAARKKR